MSHYLTTRAFLAAVNPATRAHILREIARHYGITPAAALDEITDPEAEHLLDYLDRAVTRAATQALMQRHGLA
jgi:hypothetical protein